jgi:hypothetical protein
MKQKKERYLNNGEDISLKLTDRSLECARRGKQ